MGLDPEAWDIVSHVFKSPTGNPTGARGPVVVRVTHVPTKRALEERADGPFGTKRQASEALGRLLQSLLARLGRPAPEGKRRRR